MCAWLIVTQSLLPVMVGTFSILPKSDEIVDMVFGLLPMSGPMLTKSGLHPLVHCDYVSISFKISTILCYNNLIQNVSVFDLISAHHIMHELLYYPLLLAFQYVPTCSNRENRNLPHYYCFVYSKQDRAACHLKTSERNRCRNWISKGQETRSYLYRCLVTKTVIRTITIARTQLTATIAVLSANS